MSPARSASPKPINSRRCRACRRSRKSTAPPTARWRSRREGFTYDTNGFTQSVTDWNGNQTWFTNNSHGLPTSIVFASGSTVSHTTSITYDTTWARLAHIITTPGLTITLNYESASGTLLTRVATDTTSTSIPYSTNGQTRTWTYTYTSTRAACDRRNCRAPTLPPRPTFTYTGGVLTTLTDALGHNITCQHYKPGGLPLTVHDPNNTLTTLAYSPRLWLTIERAGQQLRET